MAASAAAPLVSRTFSGVAAEFLDRMLGRREKQRLGATLTFAAATVQHRLDAGDQVRDDNFLERSSDERSAADEVAEGVLRAAQGEHEERKLRFFGNLLGNLAFDSAIDRGYANLLVRTAERISYRQLCLLQVFASGQRWNMREADYRKTPTIPSDVAPVLYEAYDLYARDLVNCSGTALLSLTDVEPARMKPQGAGLVLIRLMELREIPEADIGSLASTLSQEW